MGRVNKIDKLRKDLLLILSQIVLNANHHSITLHIHTQDAHVNLKT